MDRFSLLARLAVLRGGQCLLGKPAWLVSTSPAASACGWEPAQPDGIWFSFLVWDPWVPKVSQAAVKKYVVLTV